MRLIKCQKRYEYNEKAGYSSSMKFRKLSGSIKSLGSLDRSMSHSSAKRTLSNSLDRSVLRHVSISFIHSPFAVLRLPTRDIEMRMADSFIIHVKKALLKEHTCFFKEEPYI